MLTNRREELWNNLSFLSQKVYNESNFIDETKKHFGARGFTGSTGNYNGFAFWCMSGGSHKYGITFEIFYT